MKEAVGELNITVIVVVSVALLAFFFFSVLWPSINSNFKHNTNCDDAICVCDDRGENGKCLLKAGSAIECHVKGNENEKITCPWKG